MKIKLGCCMSPRSFYATLVLILLHTCAHIQTQFIGDECKEKVALAILCKFLPKKTLENVSIFIYEECQVCL